jgi:hypothetical protein
MNGDTPLLLDGDPTSPLDGPLPPGSALRGRST